MDESISHEDVQELLPAGSSFKVEMALNGNGVLENGNVTHDALFKKSRELIHEYFWER